MLLNHNTKTYMSQADVRGLKIKENDSNVFLATSNKPGQPASVSSVTSPKKGTDHQQMRMMKAYAPPK